VPGLLQPALITWGKRKTVSFNGFATDAQVGFGRARTCWRTRTWKNRERTAFGLAHFRTSRALPSPSVGTVLNQRHGLMLSEVPQGPEIDFGVRCD